MNNVNKDGSVLIVENADKKIRRPRNLESITLGALSLDLKDRVALSKRLKESIASEVEALTTQAKNAAELVNGTA